MKNIPLIIKSFYHFYPVFNDFEGIEMDAGFDFVCPKCKIRLKGLYQIDCNIEDVKFCFNCGVKIDGNKAYEISKKYKKIIYRNRSKFNDILCESCGECKNRKACKKDNIGMCDIIRENVRKNMGIVTKVNRDKDGRPMHCIILNSMDNFEDLVNGKE